MTNYIERYWRDAKPEDAIKEPPMVARFRDEHYKDWVIDKLIYWDRSETPWHRDDGFCYERCQVYDTPDPGEGWRLIDTDSDTKRHGDEYLHPDGTWYMADSGLFRCKYTYRRRTTPTVTYVPFTWEDREQLRGRWVTWRHENGLAIESYVNHLNEHKLGGLLFRSHDAKWLLENATFLDTGEPVGKKVTQ